MFRNDWSCLTSSPVEPNDRLRVNERGVVEAGVEGVGETTTGVLMLFMVALVRGPKYPTAGDIP